MPVPPERDFKGKWLDDLTGLYEANIKGIHLRLPGYDDSGPTLEIFEYSNKEDNFVHSINTTGFSHIAFRVDDVQQYAEKIIQNGGKKYGELVSTLIPGAGELTMIYMRDPEDNIIELQNWKQ